MQYVILTERTVSSKLFPNRAMFSKQYKTMKIQGIQWVAIATTAFSLFYLLAFMVAGLFNQTIKNPFEYNHLLMWLLFGILIPVILLLIDKNDNLKQKSFLRNFISASLLLIDPIGVMYILQLLQYYSVGYFGLASDLNDMHETLITSSVVNNLSYLALIVLSLVTAYNHYSPFNKIAYTIGINNIDKNEITLNLLNGE